MSNDVVIIDRVSRQFGRNRALDDVSLTIPKGAVFGLVGENGSGKTTLIKHVLGLLRAQTGSVRIFGLDPVKEPVSVLSRVGYLSEDRDLPAWMPVRELMRYTRAFYPHWDDAFAEELRKQFDLDPKARVKTLSQGQKARTGLMLALAYRPDLLVLDEPSTGLDPVVRRDILGAILRTIADEGRTVIFSSHLLDEVERVSDHVAMLDRGKVVLRGSIDEVQAAHHRVTLRFDELQVEAPRFASGLSCEGMGREWTALCRGEMELITAEIQELGAEVVDEAAPSLDEIFVAKVGARRKVETSV